MLRWSVMDKQPDAWVELHHYVQLRAGMQAQGSKTIAEHTAAVAALPVDTFIMGYFWPALGRQHTENRNPDPVSRAITIHLVC